MLIYNPELLHIKAITYNQLEPSNVQRPSKEAIQRVGIGVGDS